MSQGTNVNIDELKFVDNLAKETDTNIAFDYSAEGLQNTLNTLIKINSMTFNT